MEYNCQELANLLKINYEESKTSFKLQLCLNILPILSAYSGKTSEISREIAAYAASGEEMDKELSVVPGTFFNYCPDKERELHCTIYVNDEYVYHFGYNKLATVRLFKSAIIGNEPAIIGKFDYKIKDSRIIIAGKPGEIGYVAGKFADKCRKKWCKIPQFCRNYKIDVAIYFA